MTQCGRGWVRRGTVADTLAVAWDIFELVQVVANGCADHPTFAVSESWGR